MSMVFDSGNALYGPAQYAAMHEGKRYFWIDGKINYKTEVHFDIYDTPGTTSPWAGPEAGQDASIICYQYPTGAAGGTADPFLAGSSHVVIFIDSPGFYTFEINNVNLAEISTPLYLTMSIHGTSSVFRFDAIPGLVERAPDIQALLMLGSSIMLSPTSATLAKGGEIFGIQLPERQVWGSFFDVTTDNATTAPASASCTAQLTKLAGIKKLDFSTGMYSWHRPTSEECVGWLEPFVFTDSQNVTSGALGNKPYEVVDMCGLLQPPGGWTVLAVDGAASILTSETSAEYPSMTFLLTTNYSLNTATTSSWYHVEPPTVAIDVRELPTLLQGLPNQVENPLHWSDITSWISNNASKIVGAAKAVGGVIVGALAPEALPAYAAVTSLV